MFERRLKIILIALCALTGVLLVRAARVQLTDHGFWSEQASRRLIDEQLIETTRGPIVDVRGRPLAADVACMDACVDYRAILHEPDEKWVRDLARSRLRRRLSALEAKIPSAQREQWREEEITQVKADIQNLWATLSDRQLTGHTREQVEEIRQTIVRRVELRRRYIWYQNYVKAQKEHEQRDPSPWYARWLMDESQDAPQVDGFDVTIGEQLQAHVVLNAISPELYNYLGKNLDRFPGLVLRPGTHRTYPYGQAACHVIGHLAPVSKEDRARARAADATADELRRYRPMDLIGRLGIEALCEQTLRGTRGRIERISGEDTPIDSRAPVSGQGVRMSLDIELQRQIEDFFAHPCAADGQSESFEMYGGAVVIDVPTGQVRALVSYPTFDLNELDEHYAELLRDDINRPLLNRATQMALEPGSTVKPVVGIAGLSEGVVGLHEGIECTGALVLNGHTYSFGRCWVASRTPWDIKHHHIPVSHQGTFGNPDGFLTYPEALERSCNIYFEAAAHRLGIQRLSQWMDRFGLGRPTGIGLPEHAGRLPRDFHGPANLRLVNTWFGGIGQGNIAATPIQMANVAATIARDGVWVRPRLVDDGAAPAPAPATQPVDRVDLHLRRDVLAEAKQGMLAVVNNRAGTGTVLQRPDMDVAGKTGTAQAAKFHYPARDARGEYILVDGRRQLKVLDPPSSSTYRNPLAPWYRGSGTEEKQLAHAWFIGFAPAEHPQIAFAVLVEYGGGGGKVAGGIAKRVLEACVEHGYLAPERKRTGVTP